MSDGDDSGGNEIHCLYCITLGHLGSVSIKHKALKKITELSVSKKVTKLSVSSDLLKQGMQYCLIISKMIHAYMS